MALPSVGINPKIRTYLRCYKSGSLNHKLANNNSLPFIIGLTPINLMAIRPWKTKLQLPRSWILFQFPSFTWVYDLTNLYGIHRKISHIGSYNWADYYKILCKASIFSFSLWAYTRRTWKYRENICRLDALLQYLLWSSWIKEIRKWCICLKKIRVYVKILRSDQCLMIIISILLLP